LTDLYLLELQRLEEQPEQATAILAVGAAPYDPSLNPAQLAALTVTINAIFNLDEAKYK